MQGWGPAECYIRAPREAGTCLRPRNRGLGRGEGRGDPLSQGEPEGREGPAAVSRSGPAISRDLWVSQKKDSV